MSTGTVTRPVFTVSLPLAHEVMPQGASAPS
ncbi:MAG: hypothetical protein JWQ91_2049 [Aeromicrobium sp.]|nr:hypothetical protein [Aeromicrobium sp.]